MAVPEATKSLVVVGPDAARVAREVAALRARGLRVAGFVGEDEETALAMAVEMLGGCDDVLRV